MGRSGKADGANVSTEVPATPTGKGSDLLLSPFPLSPPSARPERSLIVGVSGQSPPTQSRQLRGAGPGAARAARLLATDHAAAGRGCACAAPGRAPGGR